MLDGGTQSDTIVGDSGKVATEPGNDRLYYAKVKGTWSVTQDGTSNDGSTVDRTWGDSDHTQAIFDDVSGVEQVTKGAMPR